MTITRFEYEKACGYQVRVFSHGQTITKFFAYKKHGGKKKAFALAVKMERQLKKEYPESPSRRKGNFADKPNKNNTSGIIGISAFIKGPYRRPSIQFCAYIRDKNIYRSGAKYGILGALQLVLDARQKATGMQLPSAMQAWAIIKRNKGW